MKLIYVACGVCLLSVILAAIEFGTMARDFVNVNLTQRILDGAVHAPKARHVDAWGRPINVDVDGAHVSAFSLGADGKRSEDDLRAYSSESR